VRLQPHDQGNTLAGFSRNLMDRIDNGHEDLMPQSTIKGKTGAEAQRRDILDRRAEALRFDGCTSSDDIQEQKPQASRQKPGARSSEKLLAISLFLIVSLPLSFPLHAHVGSPDVFYEGAAGPYRVYVTVRVPQVIPGVAEIEVRSASNDVQAVRIVPMRLSGPGSNLPPIADLAQRSKQDPQFFTGSLWLMEFGALQVRIEVDGDKGKANLSVPVPAFARQSLPMDNFLKGLLGFLMFFLSLGMVLIAGAVVRESNVPPGEKPRPARMRWSKVVMAITAVVMLAVLWMGRSWWGAEASQYQRGINYYKPPLAETSLEGNDGGRRLIISARGQDKQWSEDVKMAEAIPDHGHLMHLFLIGMPGMDRMWHLHPERIEGGRFAIDLPEMPAGRYQLFADVVDKNGFPWTLTGNLDLPRNDLPKISGNAPQADDSAWQGGPMATQSERKTMAQLPDGTRIVWHTGAQPLKSGDPTSFKFTAEDRDGTPLRDLVPYMGMAAHAEVVSSDFSVFAHIHPAGSVSMAALDLAQTGLPAPSGAMSPSMHMPAETIGPDFSFPYGFPHPGRYRIFVQIKRAGKVQTGVFDVDVS